VIFEMPDEHSLGIRSHKYKIIGAMPN